MPITVDILLSTYNGESFLKDQIDSILDQTYQDWRLLVRDDGSSDNTEDILRKYTSKYQGKMILLEDDKKHLGACQSFAQLLNHSAADYIMFCDQDDVWLPEKVDLTLARMREMESNHPGLPILIHTDLSVADENMNVTDKSFWEYQSLDPSLKSLEKLLLHNNTTGCTVMINKELKELSYTIPKEAIIHDWWLTLIASAFGRIDYLNLPLVLYRQHGENVFGAIRYSFRYFVARIGSLNRTVTLVRKIVAQSGAFCSMFEDRLLPEKIEVLKDFSNILGKGRITRLHLLMKYKLRVHGFLRNLGFIFLLLFVKNKDDLKTFK